MADSSAVRVTENVEAKRFEARDGDELLGVVEYIPLDGKIIATHTEVSDQYEGRGVGSTLVAGMLDALRADGRLVQPQCSYVAAFVRKHDEYADLVDPDIPQ